MDSAHNYGPHLKRKRKRFFFLFKAFFKATSRYNNNNKKHKGFRARFRAKVQFTCWLKKMSDDPLYLSGLGSAHSLCTGKCIFLKSKSALLYDASREFWVLIVPLPRLTSSSGTGLHTGVTGVCVWERVSGCVVAFFVALGPPSSVSVGRYHLPCSVSSLFSTLCKWQCFGLEVVSGGGGRKTSRRVIHILGFLLLLPVCFYVDIPPPSPSANTPQLQLNIQTQTG